MSFQSAFSVDVRFDAKEDHEPGIAVAIAELVSVGMWPWQRLRNGSCPTSIAKASAKRSFSMSEACWPLMVWRFFRSRPSVQQARRRVREQQSLLFQLRLSPAHEFPDLICGTPTTQLCK